MNTRKNLALAITLVGLLLTLAGPFLPGGIHLIPNDPPRAGHVTTLVATPQGDILVGTQAGEVWRLRDGLWQRDRLSLGEQPVTALLGEPGRTSVGTAAGLFFAPPGAPPLEGRISSLVQTDQGLLAGTPEGVRRLAGGIWGSPGPTANIYRLILQRRPDGDWLHAGTIGAGVLSIPVVSAGMAWQPNNQGLPEAVKVFSFATTPDGRLLAGTDQGLFWQPGSGQPWRSLHPALDGRRILALWLDVRGKPEAERLWIGADDGLLSLDLATRDGDLVTAGDPRPADQAENQPPFGISGIVPWGDRLMVSAGAVYEYGPTSLRHWYWVSLVGVLLILIAGWLMPRPEVTTESRENSDKTIG